MKYITTKLFLSLFLLCSSVVVLDARHAAENGVAPSGALYCRGMSIHILTEGQRFDLAHAAEDYSGRTP